MKTLDDYRLEAVMHLHSPAMEAYRLRGGVDHKPLVMFSEAQRNGAKYAVEVTTLEQLLSGQDTSRISRNGCACGSKAGLCVTAPPPRHWVMTVVGPIELLGRLAPETLVVTRGDTAYVELKVLNIDSVRLRVDLGGRPDGTYEFSGNVEGQVAVVVDRGVGNDGAHFPVPQMPQATSGSQSRLCRVSAVCTCIIDSGLASMPERRFALPPVRSANVEIKLRFESHRARQQAGH